MNKLLVSIMILSLVEAMAAAGAGAGIWYPTNDNCASDNILLTASSVTVIEIQDDAGPTYIVCLESATQPSGKPSAPGETSPFGGAERVTYTSITSLLPEPATIALLGFSGFLMRHRRNVRRRRDLARWRVCQYR